MWRERRVIVRGLARADPMAKRRWLSACMLNYFRVPAFLAARDPVNFPPGRWEAHYRRLALDQPADQPLPIPE